MGDHLVVRPHEVIPVDVVLLSQSALIDESQLTGEAMPVNHARGEALCLAP